jgi:hypothetical protein
MGKTIMLGELGDLEKKILEVVKKDFPEAFYRLVEQIAAEIMTRTIEKTPKKTGRLQDGWEFQIIIQGQEYIIRIINLVEYAEHVEYGHRIAIKVELAEGEKQPMVPGVHMLEKALMEVFAEIPEAIGNWLEDFIAESIL